MIVNPDAPTQTTVTTTHSSLFIYIYHLYFSADLLGVLVRLDVLGQMVRPHEPLGAGRAGEPLLSRVGPEVPLEFVRPGEPLAAEEPVADEGAFACVPPKVSLEVGGFAVDLIATRVMANVNLQDKEKLV